MGSELLREKMLEGTQFTYLQMNSNLQIFCLLTRLERVELTWPASHQSESECYCWSSIEVRSTIAKVGVLAHHHHFCLFYAEWSATIHRLHVQQRCASNTFRGPHVLLHSLQTSIMRAVEDLSPPHHSNHLPTIHITVLLSTTTSILAQKRSPTQPQHEIMTKMQYL